MHKMLPTQRYLNPELSPARILEALHRYVSAVKYLMNLPYEVPPKSDFDLLWTRTRWDAAGGSKRFGIYRKAPMPCTIHVTPDHPRPYVWLDVTAFDDCWGQGAAFRALDKYLAKGMDPEVVPSKAADTVLEDAQEGLPPEPTGPVAPPPGGWSKEDIEKANFTGVMLGAEPPARRRQRPGEKAARQQAIDSIVAAGTDQIGEVAAVAERHKLDEDEEIDMDGDLVGANDAAVEAASRIDNAQWAKLVLAGKVTPEVALLLGTPAPAIEVSDGWEDE